jgi:hypothetical protein
MIKIAANTEVKAVITVCDFKEAADTWLTINSCWSLFKFQEAFGGLGRLASARRASIIIRRSMKMLESFKTMSMA